VVKDGRNDRLTAVKKTTVNGRFSLAKKISKVKIRKPEFTGFSFT